MTITVGDIASALEQEFPAERADDWDRVGLLVGDPDSAVDGVVFALDPTRAAVRHAAERGANVLVTHHPAFLKAPSVLVPGSGPAGVAFEAIASGVALINAHTNLDRDPRAARLLPSLLGLTLERPVENKPRSVSIVTVYVPPNATDEVSAAMRAAGAGRIGDYEGCRFVSGGTGSFTPGTDSEPSVGRPGEPMTAEESRVEMVCPRDRLVAVMSAAASVHPYEEPLISATDVLISRNRTALGALSRVPDASSITLEELATRVGLEFGIIPRVWGDPSAPVSLIATATGSASSLTGAVLRAGADALVAGEVRYHDALDASQAGLGIVEMGHDVSEWPLVGLLADAVRAIPGIDVSTLTMLPPNAGWWTPEIPEGA